MYTAAIAGAFYFPWRTTIFNPHALVLSGLLYTAELFGLVCISLHAFMTWRVLERKPPLPLQNQTVDVFVPTYNESVEMLRRTLMAARDMKYPHRTWLLDDGHRSEMAALAAEMGVDYLSREKNTHAKAGNLNHALARSSGQFIAIFDADHIPHQNYLVRTLGYFNDTNVAFVQTPQDFYNLDSFQHRREAAANVVWTEQSLFFRVIMPGKDFWNAAFFCGSCATVRRSAIEKIGGFATETVTEDLHTSIRLHKKGFGSVYHAESLAYGVAPDTFEPYESQRVRWGQGAMQVWRLERILTGRGLTLPQRLCYLASALTYFDGWQKAFMFLLPSFVLATGILPVSRVDWTFAAIFLPWYILSLWACEELGRGYARSWLVEQYNFLRFPGFAFATLTFFLNRRLPFRVTRKGSSSRRENVRRMRPQLAVIAIGVLSLSAGLLRYTLAPHLTLTALILNVIWSVATLVISTSAVRFALRHSKQERASYRFHVPVPVRIRDAAGHLYLVRATDISSGGFSAILPFGAAIGSGARLEAEIVLPSGTTQVRVEVRRVLQVSGRERDPGQMVAARFDWPSQHHMDALDSYLYGSSPEWRLQRLVDKTRTPVKRIDMLLERWSESDDRPTRPVEWQPAIAVPDIGPRLIEVLAPADDVNRPQQILSEVPLQIGDTISLVLPQESSPIAQYQIKSRTMFGDSEASMFRYALSQIDFETDGTRGVPGDEARVHAVETAA